MDEGVLKCALCQNQDESLEHSFMWCPKAEEVWKSCY